MSFFRALSLACLFALGTHSSAEAPVVVKSKDRTSEGSTVLVRAFHGSHEFKGLMGGADVSLNRRLVGKAPWTEERLETGSWIIGVKAEGYRYSEFTLWVEGKKDYEVAFNLEEERGFVFVEASPPDVELLEGGRSWQPGLVELSAGYHELRARRFGYLEASYGLSVKDRETSTLRVSLQSAPFEASEFAISRPTFNPANSGPLGLLQISFRVSSYGSGILEILDEGERTVFSRSLPSFETWQQSLSWDGRDPEGGIHDDGSYEVRLRTFALGQEAGQGDPQSRYVVIDSSSIARPYGSGGALAGLSYFPEIGSIPAGLGTLDVAAAWDYSRGGALVSISGSWSAENLLFGLRAQSGFASADLTTADLEAGLVWPLEGASFLDFALAGSLGSGVDAEGTWSFRGLFLTPALLHFPELPDARATTLSIGLAPGFSLAWKAGQQGPGLALEAESGIALATSSWKLGLSARSSLLGLEALAPTWSGLTAAIEGRLVLAPSPLVVFSSLSASLSPAGRVGEGTLAAGLGFWF